jgi:Zn finger protein HypA/HybF involved in hydrogenase expression
MKKIGESLSCPKCKNNTFHIVLRLVDAVDAETGEEEKMEMWQLECTNCKYGNAYIEADAFAPLEIEKAYLEEEILKEKFIKD